MSFPLTIAYDFTLMRPGCAIVQRSLGATITNDALGQFDDWLTSPTPGMQLATLRTQDELDRAIALTNQEVPA